MISVSTATTNAQTSPNDLFVLSDEQILEIAPEPQDVARDPRPVTPEEKPGPHESRTVPREEQKSGDDRSFTDHQTRTSSHDPAEPPPWLAAQMKDPWAGTEARELWDGVQRARSEAAAYRAAIATPEDARALKELYPGGVTEARAAAERARLLEDVDRAYFGAAGNSPEQLSASRAQLAQRMLREDPAAFREMVAAGLQALQAAEQGGGGAANASLPRLAQVFTASRSDAEAAPPLRATSSAAGSPQTPTDAGPNRGAASVPHESAVTSHESLSAYAAFERAANEDLERSVGSAIGRTLAQALPVAQPLMAARGDGAQARGPALHERLNAAVRQDVEKALQGDRQLGEQVAQILSSRRFDDDARAQIVRLIGERAQQLVPGAAKRVLNEWTQTTLAAHRGRMQRTDAVAARSEVAVTSAPTNPARQQHAGVTRSQTINYRKLSDEQILEM